MDSGKATKISIDACHSEIVRYEGGFHWRFFGHTQRGKEYVICISFERWWLTYLARNLKQVLADEWEEIKRLTALVGFKDE